VADLLEYDAGDYPKVGWDSRAYVFDRMVNIGCVVVQYDGTANVRVKLVALNDENDPLYMENPWLPMRRNVTRRLPKGRLSNRWQLCIEITDATPDFVLRNARFASTPMELATA